MTVSRHFWGAVARMLLGSSVILGPNPQTNRVVEGDWMDVCPCDIPCSCWQTHLSSAERCVNFHILEIRNGLASDVDISGVVFVILETPTVPHQAPTPVTLFVDRSLDPKKSQSVDNLVAQYYGRLSIRRVSIKLEKRDFSESLTIPGLLSVETSVGSSAKPAAKVSEHLYPWLSEPRQGRAIRVTYTPKNEDSVTFGDSNALTAKFTMLKREE